MQITEDRIGDVLVVDVKGRLDSATSPAFETFLLKKIDGGDTRVVLDLAALEYVSSAGLRVFMMAARRLKVVQGRVAVCALQPSVQEVFEISGFTSLFAAFADRHAAAASVSA